MTPELDAPEAPEATIMLARVTSSRKTFKITAKRIPPVHPTLCKKKESPFPRIRDSIFMKRRFKSKPRMRQTKEKTKLKADKSKSLKKKVIERAYARFPPKGACFATKGLWELNPILCHEPPL